MTADPLAARRGPLTADVAVGTSATVALRNLPWRTMVELRAVWLGPGWWLLDVPAAGAAAFEPDLVRRLRAVGGRHSAVDVSAGFAVLELTGPEAAAVLAHGCSIDLHPRAFGPDRAARTTLAKAQVVLAQTADTPTYRIWVRSSFARCLVGWLLDAMTEYVAVPAAATPRLPASATGR